MWDVEDKLKFKNISFKFCFCLEIKNFTGIQRYETSVHNNSFSAKYRTRYRKPETVKHQSGREDLPPIGLRPASTRSWLMGIYSQYSFTV